MRPHTPLLHTPAPRTPVLPPPPLYYTPAPHTVCCVPTQLPGWTPGRCPLTAWAAYWRLRTHGVAIQRDTQMEIACRLVRHLAPTPLPTQLPPTRSAAPYPLSCPLPAQLPPTRSAAPYPHSCPLPTQLPLICLRAPVPCCPLQRPLLRFPVHARLPCSAPAP